MEPHSFAAKVKKKANKPAQASPAVPEAPLVWSGMIPSDQWKLYRRAFQAMRSAKIDFMLGGGFALASYTLRWRNTKDIDFYVLPKERERAVEALEAAGFAEYYSQLPYDRGWIYRSTAGGVIVDIIWSMANRRALVDEIWFERGRALQLQEETLRVLPVEELIWSKLYVLQHDHCDWPDVLNLLYARGAELDWDHLLWRVNGDDLLIKAMCTLFDWLCPQRPEASPDAIRARLDLPKPEAGTLPAEHARTKLLDNRAWFAGALPMDRPLEI